MEDSNTTATGVVEDENNATAGAAAGAKSPAIKSDPVVRLKRPSSAMTTTTNDANDDDVVMAEAKRVRLSAEEAQDTMSIRATMAPSSAASEQPSTDVMSLRIQPIFGDAFEVLVKGDDTVYDLKETIFGLRDIEPDQQVLLANGGQRELGSDDQLIGETGTVEGDRVMLVPRMSSGLESPMTLDVDDEEEEAVDPLDSLVEFLPEPAAEEEAAPLVAVEGVKTEATTTRVSANVCSVCHTKCRPALQFLCRCGSTLCHRHRYYDRIPAPTTMLRPSVLSSLPAFLPRFPPPTRNQIWKSSKVDFILIGREVRQQCLYMEGDSVASALAAGPRRRRIPKIDCRSAMDDRNRSGLSTSAGIAAFLVQAEEEEGTGRGKRKGRGRELWVHDGAERGLFQRKPDPEAYFDVPEAEPLMGRNPRSDSHSSRS